MSLHLLKAAISLLAVAGARDFTGNTILVYRGSESPGFQKNQYDKAVQLPNTKPPVKTPNEEKREKPYDIITDWKLPSPEKVEEKIEQTIDPLRRAHSPVFFSTDGKGKRWVGLSKIPETESPLVIVGNHQFAATDVRLLMAELLQKKNMIVRALAHPVGFLSEAELRGPNTIFAIGTSDFQEFGAVPSTPRNYYRLLQTGQNVLLYPGGTKEGLIGRKDYPLFWPERVDFVRTAAKFNATILPLSAVGMVDSVNVLMEPEDAIRQPVFGELARRISTSLPVARYDTTTEDEILLPPIALPYIPARNYFVFGRPICTRDIDHRDKEQCEKVYLAAKTEVRRGLDDILRARDYDPFKNASKRLAFETLFRKKAPTFPVSQLN